MNHHAIRTDTPPTTDPASTWLSVCPRTLTLAHPITSGAGKAQTYPTPIQVIPTNQGAQIPAACRLIPHLRDKIADEDLTALARASVGCSPAEIADIFAEWNRGELESYLIEITAEVLRQVDAETGAPLVDVILDAAGAKGTGAWTVQTALDLGVPVSGIAEAVFARCLSALKDERVKAASKLRGPKPAIKRDRARFIEEIRCALYASKIVSYAQGFMLMRAAAKEYGWRLKYGNIALMWRGGCIIRSRFLDKIKEAYEKHPRLPNLMLDIFFKGQIRRSQKGWRNVVAVAAKRGIPVPAFSSALAFYDSYRAEQLPANLLQAQRDYFGAHTYERTDKPRGEFFHTDWTGHGGNVSSTSYNV